MLNKKDPLVDAVKQVMVANEKERNAVKSVNEAFGIQSKRQLPHERHAAYDAALSKAIKGELTEAVKEELVGNQHKIDANKNNKVDAHDFKLLRAKKKVQEEKKDDKKKETSKEKEPEEHGVEAEREMASKGKKMYEERSKKVADAVLSKLRSKKEKIDEKAPEGAKYERMVKHIKKGYAKDGELSKKEKSIAYATAWKEKNKAKD